MRKFYRLQFSLTLYVFFTLFALSGIHGQTPAPQASYPLSASRYTVNRLAPNQSTDESRILINGTGAISVQIISNIGNIQTSILTPSGQIITPANVESLGGSFLLTNATAPSLNDVLLIIPLLSGNFHYAYNFPAQGEGEYVIRFQAPAGLSAEVGIITEVKWENEINAKLFTTNTTAVTGKPVVLTTALFAGTQPVTGANVEVSVRDPNGARTTITLADNGGGQTDDRPGDGLYSGEFIPQIPGKYSLVAIANGPLSGGGTFRRNSLAEINVNAVNSQFTGTIANRGADDNSDGLFDRIEFRLGTQTVVAGQYQAFVELRTNTGRIMVGNGVANLAAGTGEIIANVPASVVREANENGPYTIAKIRLDQLTDAQGSQEVDRRVNLGMTLPYQISQFQRRPLILTGVFSEEAIDTNGNGRFDILRVTVQVDVLTPGMYEWNMKLANADFQDISFASNRGNLVSGLNNITVQFNGAQIRRSETNGPYEIRDLLLFGPQSLVAAEVGRTRFYNFTDFEEGGPNVSISLSPANANLRLGQTHTLNVTVTQGTTPVSSRIVTLRVLSGPNAGFQASQTTSATGTTTFTYTGNAVGTDVLRANVTVDDFLFNSNTATATWTNNAAPVCVAATPSLNLISPPDNRLVPINIAGLTDPDNDPLTISMVSIMQDEPTNHFGANPNTPDAVIQGQSVLLKAERIFGTIQVNGTTYVGNGRVYHIAFTASDGRGGQCIGVVKVGVPHVKTAVPIDGGALFDSTIP